MATGAITGRQRFCRLFDFEPVDRPPHWEAIAFWQQAVDQWVAEGGFAQGADPMVYYGIEPFPHVSGGLGLTSMALSGPPVQSRVVRDEGETRLWEDDLGKLWRDRADGMSMPQWLRFAVEGPKDWENKVRPRLTPEAHSFASLDSEIEQCHGLDGPLGLWLVGLYAFWRNFWGEEKLAYAFYDHPAVLHDMAQTWLSMQATLSPTVIARAAPDYTLFHEDMAYKNGPLIGPRLFDEFMRPYYAELLGELRRLGQTRFIIDSDGNNGPILDRFIELGIGGLFPFEVAAGYDVLEFRRANPRFLIWGGIDKRVLLQSEAEIEKEVLSKVPALLESGGFIPSIDHAVPPCPQRNFEFYLNLVRSITG